MPIRLATGNSNRNSGPGATAAGRSVSKILWPLDHLPDQPATRARPAPDRSAQTAAAAAPGMSIARNDRWQPSRRGASMIDREPPTAARRWGASVMTRLYASEAAGLRPRRLAACGAMTDRGPVDDGHPGIPSSSDGTGAPETPGTAVRRTNATECHPMYRCLDGELSGSISLGLSIITLPNWSLWVLLDRS
jgi:hypothetical protein